MSSGNWNNGVNAGARAVNANNYPWNVNTNIGVRLACDNFLCFKIKVKMFAKLWFCRQWLIRKENRQIGCPHPCGG
jgi:hypothetical protein